MRHPLDRIIAPDSRGLALAVAGVPAVLLGLLVAYTAKGLSIPGRVPQGLLSFELAGDPLITSSVLQAWQPLGLPPGALLPGTSSPISTVRLSLTLDYAFLVFASTALAMACLWAVRWIDWRPAVRLGVCLAWGQWLAGAANGAENYVLLQTIDSADLSAASATLSAARYCALLKFSLVEAGLIYIAIAACYHSFGNRRPQTSA